MTTRAAVGSVLWGLCIFALSGQVRAQESRVWGDIGCSESRIIAPSGLRCRATQDYSGGQGKHARGGGTFRRWATYGTLDGVKLYYHVTEATSIKSAIAEDASLEAGIRSMSPQARTAKGFSEMTKRGGVDFVTFAGAAGEACIGVRRYGPATKTGFKWILNATRCAPKGKAASDPEIDRFIAEAGYRS